MRNAESSQIKLVFDFDYTLFAADLFKNSLATNLSYLGISSDIFLETYQQSKKNDKYLGFEYQAKLIKKLNPQLSLKELNDSFKKSIDQSSSFVYPETLEALGQLSAICQMILISFGERKLQMEKIKRSKIDTFFSKIIIAQDSKKIKSFQQIFEMKKKIFYIEDNPSAIQKIKEIFPSVITIRIKRSWGTYTHKVDNPSVDYSIKNLLEIRPIINKIVSIQS